MNRKRVLQLQDFNPHIICSLCNGYYIDATTITECLHSFCRACIVRYLQTNRFCPVCDVQVHKSQPLLNIRKDETLQALVYKLVPGLFQKEMRLRQEFADQHPEATPSKIDDPSELCIYSPEEYFSLTLEHWSPTQSIKCNATGDKDDGLDGKDAVATEKPTEAPIGHRKRYLRCPAAVTVRHLHKLIRGKHGLNESHLIELLWKDEVLQDHLTLVDVAYIYKWKRKGPLSLSYRIYTHSYKRVKFDGLSTEGEGCSSLPSEPYLVEDEDLTTESKRKTEPTGKITDWQEVQLQISETGIMSVSGVSLEHNNNLSTPNNNIFDNQAKYNSKNHAEKLDHAGLPKYLAFVDSYCDEKGAKHQELTLPRLKIPSTVASKQEEMLVGSSCKPDQNLVGNKQACLASKQESVGAVGKEKKSFLKGKTCKTNIQIVSEPAEEMKSANACSPLQPAYLEHGKRFKLADVPKLQNDIIKPVSDSNIRKDISKSNEALSAQVGTKKELLFYQPIGSTSNTPHKFHQNLPVKNCGAKSQNLTSAFAVTPVSSVIGCGYNNLSQGTMSYNTQKDSPKTWNPSFTKASYPILKTKASIAGSNANNNSEIKAEKAPNFFKIRNMPRYLGNPASGVKPMYQLSDNSKTLEAEPSTKAKNVVMKIDPKTLSPIMCTTTSEGLPSASGSRSKSDHKSSQAFCSQKSAIESTNCSTSVSSPEFDSSKKLFSEKSKLAVGNQVLSSSTLAMNTTPALTNSKSTLTSASELSFKMSHARSIPATAPSSHHHEFCAPLQRSLGGSISETTSSTATPGIKFSSVPNFSLNPATLNLLSSNLTFLPNASNFLYGNFADFGPPLVRPGLSRSGCLGVIPSSSTGGANSVVAPVCVGGGSSGLPAGMGAFHAMPPSINMLFPHHRTNERDRSGSGHAQVHTPAVQRIPASRGTAPTGGHKQNVGKKTLLVGNKATNSSKNLRNDDGNESVSASGTKSDVVGTLPQAQRTDKQATNLNNNSILGADNVKKIEDKTNSVIDDESSMQKDVMMPNGEFDPSTCVTSSDTQHGSETVARKELSSNEDAEKETKGKKMPCTDLSVTIKTGDKHRNLSDATSDNNNKKVKFPSICLESSSPVLAPDVISKPSTDPR